MNLNAKRLALVALSSLFILCACSPTSRPGSSQESAEGSATPCPALATDSMAAGCSVQTGVTNVNPTETPTPSPTAEPSVTPSPTETPTPTPTIATTSGTPAPVGRVFPPIDRSYPAPAPLPAPATVTGFKNTNYYMTFETDFSATDPKDQDLLDLNGKVLAKVSAAFAKSLLLEGSGELADGRILNFAGRVGGKTRFHETIHYWGRAGGNCALKPYKSIAIDPSVVAQGSTVFIDETLGMVLPDGSLHDGVWYADDTGGAILKERVDIFVGKKEWAKSLSLAGIKHMQALTIRILAAPPAVSCLDQSPQ